MPRDYKHRTQAKKNSRRKQPSPVSWWKWLLVALIIVVFVGFLNFLRTSTPETAAAKVTPVKTKALKKVKKPVAKKARVNAKAEKPHFEFYTRLPKETVVTDYEIKTRVREERVGKNKPSSYMIQAGSFRKFGDADKRRAQLALMGFESHIEKVRIGNTVWHRIKLGPFSRPSAVSTIQSRLKQEGIDVIITEK